MKKYLSLITIVMSLAAVPLQASSAGVRNQKFYEETTRRIFSSDIPDFDISEALPDSLMSGNSAIILCSYVDLLAKTDTESAVKKSTLTGKSIAYTTKTRYLRRTVIKLLDKEAIEENSEFEFGKDATISILSVPFYESKNSFGARIIKSDGKIVAVSLDDAIEITEGKKENELAGYKIAVPGIETGDILDYFYYTESWADEIPMPPFDFKLYNRYPTRHRIIHAAFSPELTVEYTYRNGAPEMVKSVDANSGRNILSIHAIDLEAIPVEIGCNPDREVPSVPLQIFDNRSSDLYFRPSLQHPNGLNNFTSDLYFSDIALMASRTDVSEADPLRKAVKYFKQYKKANPDSDLSHDLDAAFLSLNYALLMDEDSWNDLRGAIAFAELIGRLKLPVEKCALSFACSRFSAGLTEIISWDEPDFFLSVDGRIYQFNGDHAAAPRDIPSQYHGEQFATFHAEIKNLSRGVFPEIAKLPLSRSTANSTVHDIHATIDPDNSLLTFTAKATCKGSAKETCRYASEQFEWAKAAENYLGISSDQRSKSHQGEEQPIKDRISKHITELYGTKEFTVTEAELHSPGCMPDSPELVFSTTVEASDLVTDTGDEIIVKLGQLAGTHKSYIGSERDRKMFMNFLYPSQESYNIELQLPEGYEVAPESLEAFNSVTTTRIGVTGMQINNENDMINLRVMLRNNSYAIAPDNFSDFLQLQDKMVELQEAELILRRI